MFSVSPPKYAPTSKQVILYVLVEYYTDDKRQVTLPEIKRVLMITDDKELANDTLHNYEYAYNNNLDLKTFKSKKTKQIIYNALPYKIFQYTMRCHMTPAVKSIKEKPTITVHLEK